MKHFQSQTAWFFIESRQSILLVAIGHTVQHKIDHTSDLETCGPATVVVELEWPYIRSHGQLHYVKSSCACSLM